MTKPTLTTEALRALVQSVACVLVVACATADPPVGQSATVPGGDAVTGAFDTGQERAISAYQDYLVRYPHSREYDSIARRLADLLVERAADQQLAADTTPGDAARLQARTRQDYAEAIGYYEYLLQNNAQVPDNTALLYQLSRAYEESGESQQALAAIHRLLAQQPLANSQLYADTCFRSGGTAVRGGCLPGGGRVLPGGD